MSKFLDNSNRRIIPRWRDFRKTCLLGELTSIETAKKKNLTEGDKFDIEKRILEWKANRTLSFAADLVSVAFVSGEYEKAVEAAQYILSNENKATSILVSLARRILDPAFDKVWTNNFQNVLSSKERIKRIKVLLREDPRDVLLWVDRAREYTILGQTDHALWAMNFALKMAPTNRFVLRSATRLFIHCDEKGVEKEKAHFLLKKTPITKKDPWLLAAEIAVASILDKTSKFMKLGKEMIDSKSFSPFDISELSGVIATIELAEGSTRRAKKLFNKALIKPTENSVAQAEWATREITGFELDPQHLNVASSFEARTWRYYYSEDWDASLKEALDWLTDQPFSTRPAIHGSYVASVALENYEQSIEIAEKGLAANPYDFTLLNNIAFALASLNKVDEAEKKLNRVDKKSISGSDIVALLATTGLVYFRKRDQEAGRKLYKQAIEKARQFNSKKMAALAAIYLAREEILAATSEMENAYELALRYTNNIKNGELNLLINRLKALKDQLKLTY